MPLSQAHTKLSIICVDDEEVILQSLRRQLREVAPGYRVEIATNGDAALSLIDRLSARGRPVALLITDQVMPQMTGDELLQQLTHKSPQTYQVMLTGQASSDAVGRAVNEANLFRYLSKPWSKQDLALTVERAIEAYRRDLELKAAAEALSRAHEQSLRFVPLDYLKALGREHIEDVQQGDSVAQRVSIMFADIRAFTQLIESMTPEESFEFVNLFYAQTEGAIYDHGGFVDHYAGDGVMAIFPNQPQDALDAAISFSRAVDALNDIRMTNGEPPLEIGIGLHIGDVMMGVCGGERCLQCTVIGDAVNLTARLEGLASHYKTRLVISHDHYQSLGDQRERYQVREIDLVRVKGRHEPVQVFEVLDALPSDRSSQRGSHHAAFDEALHLMRVGQWDVAQAKFSELATLTPQDEVARLHAARCASLMSGQTVQDVRGVYTMQEK